MALGWSSEGALSSSWPISRIHLTLVPDLVSVSSTNRCFGPKSDLEWKGNIPLSQFSAQAPAKLEDALVYAAQHERSRASAGKRKVKTTPSDKSEFILFTTDITCGRLDPDDGKVLDGFTNVSLALKRAWSAMLKKRSSGRPRSCGVNALGTYVQLSSKFLFYSIQPATQEIELIQEDGERYTKLQASRMACR